MKRTLPYLNEEAKVLDFGCGTGNTTIPIPQKVKEIVAIDTSEEMMEKQCRRQHRKSAGTLPFVIRTDEFQR